MSKKENQNLFYENENGFTVLEKGENEILTAFCEDYRQFITKSKTEREFCDDSVRLLETNGFTLLSEKDTLQSGDKIYTINRGKGVFAAVIGEDAMEEGINLIGAHIDSPRLDLKPNPLYEDSEIAYFKTHYYGGIKKYQWTTVPLSIHGVVVLENGTQIRINIGEDDNDPVFCVTDLLPHLADNQMVKKAKDVVTGENLNIILGSILCDDKDAKERVKANILQMLYDKYNIKEADFISSEIEAVPAYPARDVGLDRSMIGGYGHDDRVCGYTALRAILDIKKPKKTAVCLLVDKEEVGSMGATGMRSRFFENTMAKICHKCNPDANDLTVRECLSNSTGLSADVGTAFDPSFPDVSEKRNNAFLNHGIVLTKYTGSRGKSGASDASAELVAKIRRIFNENKVAWQIAELGKVDLGGGGTIAQYVANLDMDVIDTGTPLLSMHSPFELAGKLDIYMTYKGYRAFYIYG